MKNLTLLALLLAALPAQAGNVSREGGAIPTISIPTLQAPLQLPTLTNAALPGAAGLQLSGAAAQALVQPGTLALPASAATANAPQVQAQGAKASGAENHQPAPGHVDNSQTETTGNSSVDRNFAELHQAFDKDAPDSLDSVSVEPEAGRAYHASPDDWRDEILYSVLLDRFARGPKAQPVGDPKSGLTRHGGDLQGVIAKLDYIKASGVTTLLLSPVTKTVPEAYHGYAPVHFMAVDPHLGTLADFKQLVAEAHKRGLKVVLDLVINHTGPVFEYEGGPAGSGWAAMDQPRKNIGYWTNELKPVELTNPDRFTRRGVIGNWDDHEQATHGDFPPNYRHLATDDKTTQDDLIKIASWWIKETDLDGFRLDAIRHVDQGFLARFNADVKAYASRLGKKNFMMLGENSTGVDAELQDNLDKGLDTVYNYPEFRRILPALHGKAPTQQLEASLKKGLDALKGAASSLVRFIDLHDTYRFLRDGENPGLLNVAMAYLLFSLGIPLIYYGTEQAFRTSHGRLEPENGKLPADPENRQDMFAEGAFKSASSAGDKFDETSPSFQFLRSLTALRAKYPALRRGYQFVRWSDPWGPGIYAISRIHEGVEVVVASNTAEAGKQATMYIDAEHSPAGTEFVDALDPSYAVKAFKPAEGGSQIAVDVPARGVRVLVKK